MTSPRTPPRNRRVAFALVSAAALVMVAACSPAAPSSPSPSPSPVNPNYAIRGNLARSLEAFESGGTARVAFMGGSVATAEWTEQVADYLEERFPDTDFDIIYAGLSGTAADVGAVRLEEDVFANGPVDLLFLEYAANGGSLEQVEGIVRHARALNPDIDIVQVHVAGLWFFETLDVGGTPGTVSIHEQVAERYGNSSLHVYQEVYDRVHAEDFLWWEFSFDSVHPTEFGCTVYSTFIIDFLDIMWSLPDQTPASTAMPAPLSEHPWEDGALIPFTQATSIDGFDTVTDWMPEHVGNLWGPVSFIASSTPGSTVTFEFDGTIVGLYSVSGPDAAIVEYSIDGAEWGQIDTTSDDWSPPEAYRLAEFFLDTSLSEGTHTITFRTIATDGTVFRLYRLMVA